MTPIQISSNARDVLRQFRSFPDVMASRIAKEIDKQNRLTINHVARTRLSYPRDSTPGLEGLRVITGTLRRGLVAGLVPARQVGNAIVGTISNNVRYAAIHEFGGPIPPRGMVYPKRAKALRFVIGGKVLFRGSVNFTKPVTIPERAPVRKGLAERTNDYSRGLSSAILAAFKEMR